MIQDKQQHINNKLIRESNYKAKRELIRNDYDSTKSYRKEKTKNEIKGLSRSIFYRTLRHSSLSEQEKSILRDDKITLKAAVASYRKSRVTNKHEYKAQLKEAKESSNIARKDLDQKKVLIDSYMNGHSLLEYEINNPRKINEVIQSYNKELSSRNKTFQQKAKDEIESKLASMKNIPSSWKSLLINLAYKRERAIFTQAFLSEYENKAHEISLKVKTARIQIKEIKSYIEDMIITIEEREKNLSILEENAKNFSQKESDQLKKKMLQLDAMKKKRMHRILAEKKSGLLTKKSFKEAKTKINQETKNEKAILALKNPKVSLAKAKEYYNRSFAEANKKNESILTSSLSDARMSTPIVVDPTKKYFLTALAAIVPGLPQIMLGQMKKGLIMFATFIPILIISWLVVMGVLGYQGNGIAGLSLGEQSLGANLTASYLIEGVIAAVFLVVVIGIMFGSSFHTWKQSLSQSMGSRTYDWTRTKNYLKQAGLPYALGLPAIIITIFIVAVPIIASFLVLFTNYDAESKFSTAEVPLEYDTGYLTDLFSGKFADTFGQVMGWTVIWTFGATFVVVFLGVVVALLANHAKVKGKGFWRLIYLLPWAIPGFITIMFFNIANSPGGELDTLFVDWFGFNPGALKSDTQLTRIWLIFMQGWLGHSYIFLLITSGLQSISKDLYEAARMDGASVFRQLRKITTPIVLYQVAPLMVGQFAFNFGNFTAIYLYSGGGPYPAGENLSLGLGQTDILATVSFKLITAGKDSKESLAAAFTFFGSLIVIIPTAIGLFRTRVFRKGKL